MNRSDVFRYFLERYIGNDLDELADATGYSSRQINGWLDGQAQPQKGTLEYVIHCALAPEFMIISKYHPIVPNTKPVKKEQIRLMLGNHKNKRGIYSFYDATADLIYIGKTDNDLLTEISQALNQKPRV